MTIAVKDIRIEDYYAPYFEEPTFDDDEGVWVEHFDVAILFTYVVNGEEHETLEWLTTEGEFISCAHNWRSDATGLSKDQVEEVEVLLRAWMKENAA